jgi:hypothetical protein
MLHLRSSRSAFLPLGALAIAAALSACGQNNQPSAMGSANVSVQALSAVPLGAVTVTISGPALYAPKPVILSPQGSGGSYGALISSLPVGSNYTFTVSASDTSNVLAYAGQATNVAILHNRVTTVVIAAQSVNTPADFVNTVPVIDSLVVSSTNIAPGETITAKVQAHDDQIQDTITYAWSANPAGVGFSAPTATTTTWTAPSTEGDVTLTIQVKDNHDATTSASIVIHVSNANGTGQADVNVKFNNWPAVSDVLATPGWITLGAPTALSVTANDADGDTLSYLWSTGTTCSAGSFSSATSSTPSFTLPASATDTYCEFDVAVSDGHGGTTHGTLYLPVGAPASIVAPAIVDAAQSASVVDPSSPVLFSVEAMDPQASALTFVWSTSAGSLSGQSDTGTTSQVRLTAPATGLTDLVVSVVVTDAVGASKKYDFSVHTAAVITVCTPAASTAWSFGVMSDTQWTGSPDDGRDPKTVAVDIINQLNAKFIAQGVKFVIQVGDLTDDGSNPALQTTALFRQKLYNAGIGFFPFRGNHESSLAGAAEFKRVFPQTQNGIMNATPADVFGLIGSVDDAFTNPVTATGGTFTMGTNFSSPSVGTQGLSYAFDYNNVRFVMLDQFVNFAGTASASGGNYLDPQLPWIASTLAGKPAGGHAFVFGHKGLITENHVDTLFGANPSVDPAGQDTFINALASNGVRYYMGGHDHMHNRSLITTTDGVTAKIQDIIGASDSSKFYIPAIPSNDQKYDVPAFGHARQTQIVQELNTVGYYIFTVDGAKVSVDYYSAIVNPTLASGEYLISASIPMTFTKRETFGYGLTGQEKLVAESASYVGSLGSFTDGTSASILAGSNVSTATDGSSRALSHLVDSTWDAPTCTTSSAILSLWGTSDLGSASGDTIALSMSFDRNSVSDATLVSGNFGLAAVDSAGNLTGAVAQNVGGTPNFVFGPWNASYTLGTYGVDPESNTVWAVVNHAGRFAAAQF